MDKGNLLYECANNIIAILKKPCALKAWAERLQDRVGTKKARVALARKLAALMYKLWVEERSVDWKACVAG